MDRRGTICCRRFEPMARQYSIDGLLDKFPAIGNMTSGCHEGEANRLAFKPAKSQSSSRIKRMPTAKRSLPTENRSLPSWASLAILVLTSSAASRLLAAESGGPPVAPGTATGRLEILGEAVESVTVAKRIGRSDEYDSSNPLVLRPVGASISIPAGEYLLQEINLSGGFRCYVPFRVVDGLTNKVVTEPEWLTISPDKPCLLKAGAPLKLTPGVYRVGRLTHLSHELLDAQGRRYYGSATPRPLPRFAIYQGDREIASSDSMSLEYG